MTTPQPTIDPWLREILRCPQCVGVLTDGSSVSDAPVGELRCATCSLAYPIENGVPVLLVDLAHPTET